MTHLQSPSFKPTRLGFDHDEDKCKTPSGTRTHPFPGNKENEAPLSATKDAHVKQWIASKNLEHLFRTKQEMKTTIQVIKIYSMDFQDKVTQLIEGYNELKEQQTSAAEDVERYQRREKELQRAHESLEEELQSTQSDYKQLQFEVENVYKPKLDEYTTLSSKYSAVQRECDALKNEKNAWTQSQREYEEKVSELTSELAIAQTNCKKPSFSFSVDDDSDIALTSRSSSQKPGQQQPQIYSMPADQWTELTQKMDAFMTSQQAIARANQSLQTTVGAFIKSSTQADDKQRNANVSAASDGAGLMKKCDELLNFMKAQKMEQRIMTMYKKIVEQFETKFAENKELAQQTLSHKFESQRASIENLLTVFRHSFEGKFAMIQQSMVPPSKRDDEEATRDEKTPKIGQSLSPISDQKDPSPLSTDSILEEMDTASDAFTLMNAEGKHVNGVIETRCAKLNEFLITEFVMVLVHNIQSASEIGFDKLVTVMMKMIRNWIHIYVDSVMAKCAAFFRLGGDSCSAKRSSCNVSHKMEAFLGELKTEINHIFIKLFQTTLNNTLNQLVPCKLEKIQIQSKISRLTQQLQAPPHSTVNTLSSIQNKKIKKQLQPVSLEKLMRNIIAVLLLMFVVGVAFGYVLLPRPQCNCFGHPF